MRQRNANASSKGLTERQEAILEEGVAAWVAEKLELSANIELDPGIKWDDIGIDLLCVDEAQNFKNLYLPEAREFGVPRFMGNAGTGSKRAWQLDFRAAAVRDATGGSGIVLLSATPAKNSPLEFYNIVQYLDHGVWERMGISDPEQFIDRYCSIETRTVIDMKMAPKEAAACVGFKNLHELRDVLFRYGDFKTSKDVGLILPEVTSEVIEVHMNVEQEDKYDEFIEDIERKMESNDPEDKGGILGILAKMSLVSIHPHLDEKYNYKTAGDVDFSPTSPKFDALANKIAETPTCGHIVFVEPLAAHRWVVETLVLRGIPRERIATLNATTAPAPADRKRIADEFNGDLDEGILPRYDVVICNQVAHEGIDLQRRTCAIHHLDLPWEPATLEQRNGRGHRQGNKEPVVAIWYYFALRSQDGLRFNLIEGKRSWLAQLLKSQDRITNNPGAQLDMGPDEILLLICRDPEAARERIAKLTENRLKKQRGRLRKDAARTLRAASARYRRAENAPDPKTAARLRFEADERLRDLLRLDPEVWPWGFLVERIRTEPVAVTDAGVPLFNGTRLRTPHAYEPDAFEYQEVGAVRGMLVGLRPARTVYARETKVADVDPKGDMEPADYDPADYPADDYEEVKGMAGQLAANRYYGANWASLGWSQASNAMLDFVWPQIGRALVEAIVNARQGGSAGLQVPVLTPAGHLFLGSRQHNFVGMGDLLPPSDDGYYRFLQAAATAPTHKFAALDATAQAWFARRIPRDLLSKPRDRWPHVATPLPLTAEAELPAEPELPATAPSIGAPAGSAPLAPPPVLAAPTIDLFAPATPPAVKRRRKRRPPAAAPQLSMFGEAPAAAPAPVAAPAAQLSLFNPAELPNLRYEIDWREGDEAEDAAYDEPGFVLRAFIAGHPEPVGTVAVDVGDRGAGVRYLVVPPALQRSQLPTELFEQAVFEAQQEWGLPLRFDPTQAVHEGSP